MIPIFDNGHGGVIKGVYQTAGKRSPDWAEGTLFEGVFNREIVRRLIARLDALGLPYGYVSPEEEDISLAKRVTRANQYYHLHKKQAYLFSVHANAGEGTGWEIFTSIGFTKSDEVAAVFAAHLEALPIVHRKEGKEPDKEANFYILHKSQCPAVLLECAFMDSQQDYSYLWSPKFKQQLEDMCTSAIMELYNINL